MCFLLLLTTTIGFSAAETGHDAWLRYAPLPRTLPSSSFVLPSHIVTLDSTVSSPVFAAGTELQKGVQGILGQNTTIGHDKVEGPSIVIGTIADYIKAYGSLYNAPDLQGDGYWLSTKGSTVHILGLNERGALYGTFQYLSMLAQGNFSKVAYASNPQYPLRWVNQWDNMDGTIERGYGGRSLFFSNSAINADLTLVSEYGRLLASIGINGIVVNSVNASPILLSTANMAGLGRIADQLRPWGVQLGISINFASPIQAVPGTRNLTTFDPLDTSVIQWWTDITNKMYNIVPDFAGYLVKANSEGQPGPLTYNRTLAEGANLFARALKPHGGVVMFRAFVYNLFNESDWKADRANAAVQFFKELDGKFDDNVVVQTKYGPIDFQVREPPSPLFANIPKTNMAIELQVSQEYLGQQDHLVYLPPLWQTILGFDLRVNDQPAYVRDVVSGKLFNHRLGGSAGVVNVSTDQTWLGSHLAMSNLYAYGRLAWDAQSDSESMLRDWIRLTFGFDPSVLDTITEMSMQSWPAYENYSGNLGIQTLTDILYTHFGCRPQSQDGNGYGQWTRADKVSIGMDRTCSNGTCFSGSYPPQVAQRFESLASTPDELLLWFHHVPYTYKLHSGKTVIQHFYDAHYEGADTAQTFLKMWEALQGKIDSERYDDILYRQTFQAGHAIEWRDCLNNYYYNLSGVVDEKKRVGTYPWRIETEDMTLDGYMVYQVNPFEAASNANAIVNVTNSTAGTATARVDYPSGRYNLAVVYFDTGAGVSQYELSINDRVVGTWTGDHENKLGNAVSIYLDAESASRKTFYGLEINRGDVVKIVGTPDEMESAPIDYIVLLPNGALTD